MKKLPSPSTVISLLALFLVLAGGAFAATRLSKNSVRSSNIVNGQVKTSDLADNAVTSSKVKDGSLQSSDFGAGQLPSGATGPSGPTGPRGATGIQGPIGPSNAYFQNQGSTVSLPGNGDWATVVSKSLPAGNWALTARVTVNAINSGSFSGRYPVYCEAWIGGTRVSAVDTQVASNTDANDESEMTMLGTGSLGSTQNAYIRCHAQAFPFGTSPPSIIQAFAGQLMLVQAGSLH